jgi:AraC family transcriptional regulator of arabinose operon
MPKRSTIRPWRLLFETRLGVRLLYCGRFVCQPEWHISSDRLPRDMIGFLFLEKHDCGSDINGRPLTLHEGDMQVLRGGDVLSMRHDPAKPITALSLSLAIEQGVVPNILLQRKFARRYRIHDRRQYIQKFDAILAALQSPLALRDWAVTSAVLQWLVLVMEETNVPLSPHAEPGEGAVDRVLFAQAWAGARRDAVLTIDEWARAVGWHPVHFERVFKQETGVTPMRWVEERRMEAARQYLSGTSKTVAEIAAAVGYPDPFYFSRVFRKHYGHPPLRYRKLGFELRPLA